MKQYIKKSVLGNSIGNALYSKAQSSWFDHTYRKRREYYDRLTADDPNAWSRQASIQRARQRILSRGYTVIPRGVGEIHTFAFLPSNWQHQNQIASALCEIGPCTRFDYVEHSYTLSTLAVPTSKASKLRDDLLHKMVVTLRETHRRYPVDWFFSYALGWDMTRDIIRLIHEEFGIPTVNISLDDKNWWNGVVRGDKESGLVKIAPTYDLGWTSASVAIPWYWAEGGQAIFLPEGVNVDWFRPLDITQDVDVGFVGSNFGYRSQIIKTLRRAGIPVEVYGANWPNGPLGDQQMLEFFNRCRINLGIGDMHYSRWLTNLKGRDFEVPATGRGLYLTTYNNDLAANFELGKEIQCYRGIDELIELLRYYLHNPDELQTMARQARERCIREHQWKHRFEVVLSALGILAESAIQEESELPKKYTSRI